MRRDDMKSKTTKLTPDQLIENLLEHSLSIGDTFRFHCTECGECCKRREDIMLSPYDLNRIARYLGVEIGKVIEDYCTCYIGGSSKLPVVIMNMEGHEKKCPFLKYGKCKIHAAKPTVCALFPLGRLGTEEDYSIRYVLQHVECGTEDEQHTVREWLGEFGLTESEAWFREWQKTILQLSKRVRGIAASLTEKALSMLGEGLLNVLYVNYCKEQDFMEQFHSNSQKAFALLDTIEEMLSQFESRGRAKC